jgi:hypothetical protein
MGKFLSKKITKISFFNLLFCYFFFAQNAIASEIEEIGGFDEGTIVQTIHGDAIIQSIRAQDDLVVSLDMATRKLIEAQVGSVFRPNCSSAIDLNIDGEFFRVSPEQKFFDAITNSWICAKDIQVGKHFLLGIDGTGYPVTSVCEHLGLAQLYDLKVDGPKNFFVGNHKILAHNYAFCLPLIGAALRGLTMSQATFGIVSGGLSLAETLYTGYQNARGKGQAEKFTEEQQALIEMAKDDKRKGGITREDMESYKDLNKGLGSKGLPEGRVRGPESHPDRAHGKNLHGHVGPVNHIPVVGKK